MKTKLPAHLAVLTANILFGINFSVVKYVTPGLIKPFGLNVVRVLVTTSLLWLLHFWERPANRLQRKDIPRFIACGLTGVAINQLIFIKGLSLTYSIHASLLMLCTPLLITLMAFVVLKEKINVGIIAGLALGVTGAFLLVSQKESSGSATDPVFGDILIALNAISYAFYFILVKPLMSKYSPLQVIRWVFTFGTLFILPAGWGEFTSAPWSSYTATNLSAIGFIAFGATFAAYTLNIYGIHHIQASATGAYIYLQPIFASTVAVVFLDEKITASKMLSAVLIFTGVFIVQRSRMKSIRT